MIKGIFILIITLQSVVSIGQNWHPLTKNEKFNYQSSENYYPTLWVDSVYEINGDSFFFTNRITKQVGLADISNSFFHSYYRQQQPQFLFKCIKINPNGNFSLINDSTNQLFFKINAPELSTWSFDTTKSIQAFISDKSMGSVLGVPDSLITILTSSGDTIILSKNHGFVYFPAFDSISQTFELVGIEERNLGIEIPRFRDVFNFDIGDVFYYKDKTSNNSYGNITTTKKVIITSKQLLGNNYQYHAEVFTKTVGGWNGDKYEYYPDQIINYDSTDFPLLNRFHGQKLGAESGETYSYYKPMKVIYDAQNQRIEKTFESSPFKKLDNTDTVYELFNYMGINEYYSKTWKVGLGQTESYKASYSGNYQGSSHRIALIAYEKNGIHYGELIPNDFVGVRVIEHYETEIKSYPNPVSTQWIIEKPATTASIKLDLFDNYGKRVMSCTLNDAINAIDLSSLSSGIYTAHFITSNKIVHHKIMKL